METPAIVTEELTKLYGRKFFRRVAGISSLDLSVERGEVFGYLGPNGAGKSTTLRCLLGLVRPTRGRATVLGLDAEARSREIRARVGYLPGDLRLDERLTGGQTVEWFGHLRRRPAPRRAGELAERLGLDLRREVRELSKGNRQKLGLVLSLMHDPELVLLDEPTAGLDPIVQDEFCRIVREGREQGRTFLLSSHVLEEVEELADRVGILRDGRLVVVETLAELRARARRRVRLHFRSSPPPGAFDHVPGLELLERGPDAWSFAVHGDLEALLRAAAPFGLRDVESGHADLGSLFLSYYGAAADAA